MGRRKESGRPINGWLVIDKGPDMTSTHVVNVVKRLTQAQYDCLMKASSTAEMSGCQ